MKVPNEKDLSIPSGISLSRLQNEGSQLRAILPLGITKSIKATE